MAAAHWPAGPDGGSVSDLSRWGGVGGLHQETPRLGPGRCGMQSPRGRFRRASLLRQGRFLGTPGQNSGGGGETARIALP